MGERLSNEALQAWGPFVLGSLHLLARLDHELRQALDISHLDYGILTLLCVAPEYRRRMSDLAAAFGVDPSTITYRVRRLEQRRFVAREASPDDGRSVLAHVTPSGEAIWDRAARVHHDGVRRHFLDHLSADEVALIGRIFQRLRARQQSASAPKQ